MLDVCIEYCTSTLKTAMRTIVCVISLLTTVLSMKSPQGIRNSSGCNSTGSENKTVYIGWPLTLRCGDFDFHTYDAYYDYQYSGNLSSDSESSDPYVQCQMNFFDSNVPFLDAKYKIDAYHKKPMYTMNITEDTQRNIQVQVRSADLCHIQNVRLKSVKAPNQTCEDASAVVEDVVLRRYSQGETNIFLFCQGVDDEEHQPYLDASQYNVTWYYNCNTELPDGVRRLSNTELMISRMDYRKHPGNYSCSVGNERFIIHHQFCVKPRFSSSIVFLRCPEIVKGDVGGNVTITCMVDAPIDREWLVKFQPVEKNGNSKMNLSCSLAEDYGITKSENERSSCSLSRMSRGPKCFDYVPTDKEWREAKADVLNEITITYRIKDIRADEFTNVRIEINDIFDGASDMDETILEIDTHPDNTALLMAYFISGLMAVLLAVALVLWLRLEIRYYWRRTFCSAKLEDPRDYGVYIDYSCLGESGKKAEYKRLIMNLRSSLERIGSTVYDAQFSQTKFQWNKENIHHVQQMCDRIMIILTPEYIQSENDDFKVLSNFPVCILVFIKTPGVDDAIKNLKAEKRAAFMIHLKRNYVIDWQSESDNPSRKFLMSLELAMPKRSNIDRHDKVEEAKFIQKENLGIDCERSSDREQEVKLLVD